MKTIQGLAGLSSYFQNVEARLDHHGETLRPLVGTLTTAFISQLDPSAPIQVRTYNGKLTNQIWLTLKNGRELKITYHPGRAAISVYDIASRRILAKFRHDANLTTVGQKIADWGKAQVRQLRTAA